MRDIGMPGTSRVFKSLMVWGGLGVSTVIIPPLTAALVSSITLPDMDQSWQRWLVDYHFCAFIGLPIALYIAIRRRQLLGRWTDRQDLFLAIAAVGNVAIFVYWFCLITGMLGGS